MGAREETGCFSSPALAAAAHRLLRARCLRAAPGLLSPLSGFSPTAAGADREAATPGNSAPRAPRAALLPCSTSAAGPAVHPVPPSKKSARPSVPPLRAPFRPRAQLEPSRDRRPNQKLEIKKEEEPGESRLPGLGPPRVQAGRKTQKERLPAWRNFYFLLLEKELRINFLWPTRCRSFGAARTLDSEEGAACARPAARGVQAELAWRGTRPRSPCRGPAPLPQRPLTDGPVSPVRASLSLSLFLSLSPSLSLRSAARLLARLLGAPALCPR